MSSAEKKIEIRPMVIEDLDAIFSIDRRIRAAGEAITYANLTTERIFTIDRKAARARQKSPTGYADLITGDVTGLFDFGFVAEVVEHVRGFVLGEVRHVGEAGTEVGMILIIGVHPDYQRKGIATGLANALCEKYRSKGIKTVRLAIDERDKGLLDFARHMGFGVGHLVDYSKAL